MRASLHLAAASLPVALFAAALPGVAHAEGGDDLRGSFWQLALQPRSYFYVTVEAGERITFRGLQGGDLEAPDGSVLIPSLPATGFYDALESGEYKLHSPSTRTVSDWDVSVFANSGGASNAATGRLYSYEWNLDLTGVGAIYRAQTLLELFIEVPTNVEGGLGFVRARLQGLDANTFDVVASPVGVGEAEERGRSSDTVGLPDWPRYRMYLNPSVPSPGRVPVLAAPTFAADQCPVIAADTELSAVVDGVPDGANWRVVCDATGDGVFDVTGDDVVLVGQQGFHPSDIDTSLLPLTDALSCVPIVSVGEVHVVVRNLGGLTVGVQMDYVAGQGPQPLRMFWDDRAVEDEVLTGEGPLVSGPSGVPSSADSDRTWFAPRGSGAVLDTWGSLFQEEGEDVAITVVAPDADRDGDGLTDVFEACTSDTSMTEADSDGDGFSDFAEFEEGTDPNDADDFPIDVDTDGGGSGGGGPGGGGGSAPGYWFCSSSGGAPGAWWWLAGLGALAARRRRV